MGLRGPHSTKLTILNPITRMRPNPLKGMSKAARNVWLRTVQAYPADYFAPSQYGLLRAYCEADAFQKMACAEIRKTGQCVTNELTGSVKRHPLCSERDSCAQVMASLATKLKLNDKQAAEPKKPKSKREGLLYNGKNP